MLKIIISGCNGQMGRTLTRIASEDENVQVVAGFDVNTTKNFDYPVYADPMEYGGYADVLVDFSNPASLEGLLFYCKSKKLPVVLCTTGHSESQLGQIKDAADFIPVFKSANMSLGINLIADLIAKATAVLGENFDVEIVERHHRRKIDAPSGTALMLADAVSEALPYDPEYKYERQSVRQPRMDNEIGISAVRGGTIVGEHEVIFAGLDEVIEIKHSAYSREVFAVGALKAAKYLASQRHAGLYDMKGLIAAT
jgi:4-hydroxy-tetrahydrodipicolinate reductase